MRRLTRSTLLTFGPLAVFMTVGAVDTGCRCCKDRTDASSAGASASSGAAADSASPPTTTTETTVFVSNDTKNETTVFVAFGSDSVVLPSTFSKFCTKTGPLACSFLLSSKAQRELPVNGAYLNATFSFGAPVACGVTKAEINVNNPQWFDIADISLVDGFSNFILLDINGTRIVPRGKDQNEKAFGVYPLGCDLCVENSVGTCGLSKGKAGCKGGTQYRPDVPCQYQGPRKGGGGKVEIMLVQPVPATP